ncbi:hypothetical protein ADUPG1_013528 [Aduncisulcus paluster]|uniref:Rad21/Rec8-like protein N-terminal domain-containing protein n=1 Tax=Aduncisulcus paluster TaxID=2918883 RepID=A0ABQ5K393_9EUKA|nr:hypothetical protein ADUPG1_013528 [Aduncisulcus paluster]
MFCKISPKQISKIVRIAATGRVTAKEAEKIDIKTFVRAILDPNREAGLELLGTLLKGMCVIQEKKVTFLHSKIQDLLLALQGDSTKAFGKWKNPKQKIAELRASASSSILRSSGVTSNERIPKGLLDDIYRSSDNDSDFNQIRLADFSTPTAGNLQQQLQALTLDDRGLSLSTHISVPHSRSILDSAGTSSAGRDLASSQLFLSENSMGEMYQPRDVMLESGEDLQLDGFNFDDYVGFDDDFGAIGDDIAGIDDDIDMHHSGNAIEEEEHPILNPHATPDLLPDGFNIDSVVNSTDMSLPSIQGVSAEGSKDHHPQQISTTRTTRSGQQRKRSRKLKPGVIDEVTQLSSTDIRANINNRYFKLSERIEVESSTYIASPHSFLSEWWNGHDSAIILPSTSASMHYTPKRGAVGSSKKGGKQRPESIFDSLWDPSNPLYIGKDLGSPTKDQGVSINGANADPFFQGMGEDDLGFYGFEEDFGFLGDDDAGMPGQLDPMEFPDEQQSGFNADNNTSSFLEQVEDVGMAMGGLSDDLMVGDDSALSSIDEASASSSSINHRGVKSSLASVLSNKASSVSIVRATSYSGNVSGHIQAHLSGDTGHGDPQANVSVGMDMGLSGRSVSDVSVMSKHLSGEEEESMSMGSISMSSAGRVIANVSVGMDMGLSGRSVSDVSVMSKHLSGEEEESMSMGSISMSSAGRVIVDDAEIKLKSLIQEMIQQRKTHDETAPEGISLKQMLEQGLREEERAEKERKKHSARLFGDLLEMYVHDRSMVLEQLDFNGKYDIFINFTP